MGVGVNMLTLFYRFFFYDPKSLSNTAWLLVLKKLLKSIAGSYGINNLRQKRASLNHRYKTIDIVKVSNISGCKTKLWIDTLYSFLALLDTVCQQSFLSSRVCPSLFSVKAFSQKPLSRNSAESRLFDIVSKIIPLFKYNDFSVFFITGRIPPLRDLQCRFPNFVPPIIFILFQPNLLNSGGIQAIVIFSANLENIKMLWYFQSLLNTGGGGRKEIFRHATPLMAMIISKLNSTLW